MTDIATFEPTDINAASRLADMSLADLKAELSRALAVTAENIAYLATIWQELERRGEDLSGLKSGLWVYMPLIAKGEIMPELVVRYAGQAGLLRRLASLPINEQSQFLTDDTVEVLELRDDAWITTRQSVTTLGARAIAQVFGPNGIRPADQQRPLVAREERRQRQEPARVRLADGGLSIGRNTATYVELRRLVTALSEERGGLPPDVVQRGAVMLTESEYEALRSASSFSGKPIGGLIRAALRTCGLLDVD